MNIWLKFALLMLAVWGQRALASSEFKDCEACPAMVALPPGSFIMGSPNGETERSSDEGPQHRVDINYRLAVGKYAVTFAEWDACVAAGGCGGYKPEDQGWGRGNRPVINVSFQDAQRYVVWLSEQTRKRYRLLNEAEWEYAARAGTSSARYWGEGIGDNQANCKACGSTWDDTQTAPVGSFEANGFGLYDMLGNVWQWTRDCWHGSYQGAPTDGSAWTEGGDCSLRVRRGCSWGISPAFVRSADRGNFEPSLRIVDLGFRVARTLP